NLLDTGDLHAADDPVAGDAGGDTHDRVNVLGVVDGPLKDNGVTRDRNRLDVGSRHDAPDLRTQEFHVLLDNDVEFLDLIILVGQGEVGNARLETGDEDLRRVAQDSLNPGDRVFTVHGAFDFLARGHLELYVAVDRNDQGIG